MWLVQRGLGALDDRAPDKLHLLAETIEALPSGVVMPLQRDHDIDRRVRQLRLTFYFREDADGPAGSLAAEELPSAYRPRGGPFLARKRVPVGGGSFPTGRDGETLPHWQRVVPPPEYRGSAAAAPAGRVQPTRTPSQSLSARLHWPALDEEQFITAEDLAPGRTVRLLGRTVRILGCDDEHPETRVWLGARGLLAREAESLPPTLDPFTEARAAAVAEAERAARERAHLSAENDELRRRRHIETAARPALRDAPHQSGRGVPALPSERPRHWQRARHEGVTMRFTLDWEEGLDDRTRFGAAATNAAQTVGLDTCDAPGAVRDAPLAACAAPARHGRGQPSAPAIPCLAPWDRAPDPTAPRNPAAPPATAPISLSARRARAAAAEIAPRPGERLPERGRTVGGSQPPAPPVKRRFRLTYFCEDDTASVVEELPPNAGDEFGGRICSRRALPKRPGSNNTPGLRQAWRHGGVNHGDTAGGSSDAGLVGEEAADTAPEAGFLRPSDLRVGEWVDVLGRRMQVVGCDASSRAVAANVYSISMPPDMVTPPPASGRDCTGTGTGNVGSGGTDGGGARGGSNPAVRLKPRAVWYDDGPVSTTMSEPPGVDVRPHARRGRGIDAPAGGCLTFGAVLATQPPGASGGECGGASGGVCIGNGGGGVAGSAAGRLGAGVDARRFVITYDVAQRHASARALACAGHMAGWVARQAPAPPEDQLGLGLHMRLNGHDFVLNTADEASLGFMEARPDRFPAADPRRALAQLRRVVSQSAAARGSMRAALANAMVRSREGNSAAGGRLSQDQFVQAVSGWEGGLLSTHAAVALFRAMAREPAEGGAARLDAPLFLAVATA